MQIVIVPPDLTSSSLRLAHQMGATGIVAGAPAAGLHDGVYEFMPWLQMRRRAEDAGLKLAVCEGIPIPDTIKLGLAERDRDLERFCRSLRHMGAAGIPVLCYNWMAVFNWLRTSVSTPVRGGAQATSYDHALMQRGPFTDAGEVCEDLLWDTLAYFLRVVVPVAEEAGVQLAMHPDDPPLSPVRGVGRIMRSVKGFERLFALAPSPANGLTFCQGCFAEMGVDIPATIQRLAPKIFFAHFRNLRGTAESFCETFHDEGDTDMYAAMRAYYAAGLDVPIRPDHVPTMEGDTSGAPGYTTYGRLFAVGYMRGLMEAIEKGQG
ncbi:MAG: mannonate dehydratase [Anaerolineae bacterium]